MPSNYRTIRNQAEAALAEARAHVCREIAGYPGPISGCDAQFNHLLAERRRLTNALNALGEEVFIPTPRSPDPLAGVESR
ncbi:MAG: hypothetical protein OEM24_04410 [Paracoccaceae bacterium]|nr:hypothetical protein [Paracoccaceae bacterium]